ncbi:MAG: hypothetical protein OXP11_05900 [Gammaproteobacteria bacterium]|nr:hypothetical protein [Gammaproteobacteria bacterium]
METKHSTNPPNKHISELSERIARVEIKMDIAATHKDLAAVCTEIADLKW